MATTRLWVRCVHGIEEVAAAEVQVRLGATAVEKRARSIFCDVSDVSAATSLLTVDDALVLVAAVPGIGPTRASLPALARGVSGLIVDTRSVDVTASFVGRRTYNRYDIEDVVGEQLGVKYISRRDGSRPPVGATSVRVHIEDETAFVGVRIADQPLHRRAYKQASIRGTLHPPVAAAMSILGGLAPGDVVVDPTCGVGTICIEAMRWNSEVRAVGLDTSRLAVEGALANGHSAVLRGDAGAIALRSGGADLVAMNPPWGRQADAAGLLRSGSASLWREVRRVLQEGACVVLLAEDELDAGLGVTARFPLSLMGSRPAVTVYGPELASPVATIRALLT